MHPFQYLGLANARQAELIREAAEARLAADLPRRDRDVEDAGGRIARRIVVAVATILVAGVALLSGGVVPHDVLAAIRML